MRVNKRTLINYTHLFLKVYNKIEKFKAKNINYKIEMKKVFALF